MGEENEKKMVEGEVEEEDFDEYGLLKLVRKKDWDGVRRWLECVQDEQAAQLCDGGNDKAGLYHEAMFSRDKMTRETPLFLMIRFFAPDDLVALTLRCARADVRKRNLCSMTNRYGETPLHRMAARGRSSSVVKLLLEEWGDALLAEDIEYRTPLELAESRDYVPLRERGERAGFIDILRIHEINVKNAHLRRTILLSATRVQSQQVDEHDEGRKNCESMNSHSIDKDTAFVVKVLTGQSRDCSQLIMSFISLDDGRKRAI